MVNQSHRGSQDNLSEAAKKMRSSDAEERSEGAHELGQAGGHKGGIASARGGSASASALAHALKGMDFPARADDLVQHARRNGDVSDSLIEAIQDLPDREFQSMADVEMAFHEEKSGESGSSSRRSGSYSSGSHGERESSRRRTASEE